MKTLKYLKRLGLHGGMLVWRVLLILGAFVLELLSLLELEKRAHDGNERPEIHEIGRPDWGVYWGENWED